MMSRIERDEEREDRISMEAIVDAYGSEEQAMGWYYYLDDKLAFPFQGRGINQRSISPLKQSEEVTVLAMAPEVECRCEMFVIVSWMEREFAVPLSQLEGLEVDEETEQTIGDWHYWRDRGYQLCE